MQTTTQHNLLNKSIIVIGALFAVTFSGLSHADEAIGELAMLDSTDKWQMNRLFEPTPKQREKEVHKGSIMIYDGLRDTTIELALDKNFERIENMMFTRVVSVDESGNEVVEDDGCD